MPDYVAKPLHIQIETLADGAAIYGYTATIPSHPGTIGTGETKTIAIGELVEAHPDIFNVIIDEPGQKTSLGETSDE